MADLMPEPRVRQLEEEKAARKFALALHRKGEGEQAEQMLTELIERRGPSSETYSILGRILKDRWLATSESDPLQARGYLERAIDAYVKAFEVDPRDPYPGINALSLIEIYDPSDPRRETLLPVVADAVKRRTTGEGRDYWEHAGALELAVLSRDEGAAWISLETALASAREGWELLSTANELDLIRNALEARGEALPWVADLTRALLRAADGPFQA